jgi:hypothetical protein
VFYPKQLFIVRDGQQEVAAKKVLSVYSVVKCIQLYIYIKSIVIRLGFDGSLYHGYVRPCGHCFYNTASQGMILPPICLFCKCNACFKQHAVRRLYANATGQDIKPG